MKTTAKKKPAAKVASKKSAPAKAVRVPEVIIRIYPHVLHVAVDGEEKPDLRILDPQPSRVAHLRGALVVKYKLASADDVKVEHRDANDNPVSS